MQSFSIRRATKNDVPAISRMGATLTRSHQAYDARRFLLVDHLEEGHAKWLGSAVDHPDTVLYVAQAESERSQGEIVGYALGRIEGRDWITLIDRHGALHEVFVAPEWRGRGIGRELVGKVCSELGRLGAPRVVLWTAWQNETAHRLFEKLGFRRTMLEMTLELT
jgi:ribosomal protein S18 acetylase RimI-like enzyme